MSIVVNAIQMVLAGSSYIPPSAVRLMGYEPRRDHQEEVDMPASRSVHFSPKQTEVFDIYRCGVCRTR
ncbi:MAG: hypothetical protein U5O39_12025 [Gammaproteobacteria bacterium]|nr:hypothetical protein [Gammaproteobacteria bacterium]